MAGACKEPFARPEIMCGQDLEHFMAAKARGFVAKRSKSPQRIEVENPESIKLQESIQISQQITPEVVVTAVRNRRNLRPFSPAKLLLLALGKLPFR